MFANLVTTPPQLAGLQAACDAYNANLLPSKDVDGKDVPPVLLTAAEYWDRVYADVASSYPNEQEVFDRATASYRQQYGV